MMGIKVYQEKMFYNFSLDKKVPEDHFLRKVESVVDLRFVRELTAPYYSHTGQPSIDPEVLFKMMLIGYFYGITSERRLAEDLSLNLAYRWYCGYDLDEETPNHSVLSKARARYGKEVFEKFFGKILEQCMKEGLVKCEKVFFDSTLIQANASCRSIVKRSEALEIKMSPKEYVEKVYSENPLPEDSASESTIFNRTSSGKENPAPITAASSASVCVENRDEVLTVDKSQGSAPHWVDRKNPLSNRDYVSKTDPEASIVGRVHSNLKLAYKEHFAIDKDHRIITAVCVTNGVTDDGQMLRELVERQPYVPKEICADSHYGTTENYHYALEHGILPSITRRIASPMKKTSTQWGPEKFKYDEKEDAYSCPAGKKLKKASFSQPSQQWYYRSKMSDCKSCSFKNQCANLRSHRRHVCRHIYQGELDKVLEHLKTPQALQTIKERKIYAEWAIAEAKTLHGLRRTRFRGKWRVGIQAFLTASVQNIKRLLKDHELTMPTGLDCVKTFRDKILETLQIYLNVALCPC